MDKAESVELDLMSKQQDSTYENKTNNEKSPIKTILETLNINDLVSNITSDDSRNRKIGTLENDVRNFFSGFVKEDKEMNQQKNSDHNMQSNKRDPLSYPSDTTNNNETVKTNPNLQGKNSNNEIIFDASLVDLDNETKNLEDWDEMKKKIYDPTIDLRKYYTTELLCGGEKDDVKVLQKWSSMVNRDIMWFIRTHKTTYLRRVKRGIPQKYRWKIWVQITNAKPLISKFQKKYYYLSKQKSAYTNLILIDISRTFPELLIFDKYAQQQLYRILNAYSNYDSSVGYCQGMNFVVGLLLVVSNFNELEAFCVLVSLMNNYHLNEFYKEKFPLLNKYIYVFEKILQNEIPDLVEHFNKEEVFPPVYLHQWMLTLFIASLPLKSVIVIWDFLFSTSIKMIIFIAVALLKILKTYLMKHKFEKILKLLKSLKYNESNDDILIAKLLIKKSEAIVLNEELKFLFENIEQDQILFNKQCKFAIENLSNSHFHHIQNNMKKLKEIEEKYLNDEEAVSNFAQLEGVPLLNFFSGTIIKRKNDEELRTTSQNDFHDIGSEENKDGKGNLNNFSLKIFSDQEKKVRKENSMSSKHSSSNSGKHFFGKYSVEEFDAQSNQSEKVNYVKNTKSKDEEYNYKERRKGFIQPGNVSFKENNDDTDLSREKSIFKKPIKRNEHFNDNSTNQTQYPKHWKANANSSSYKLDFLNYLSDDSSNSKNITKDSTTLEEHEVSPCDHLYKSDSFIGAYKKKKSYEDNNSVEENSYKSNMINNTNHKSRKEQYITLSNHCLKGTGGGVLNSKQRKSEGSINRHAYYKDNQYDERRMTLQEEKKSENIIKSRMDRYEHELNKKEKKEMDKYQEIKRKTKENQQAQREKERKLKQEESVLNISQYIDGDESEGKEDDEENNTSTLGIFNLIHCYAKDTNWFDVSTINKYYHLNKKMDYELDDINYRENGKYNKDNNTKNKKNEDSFF